jgi:hypothetical protein
VTLFPSGSGRHQQSVLPHTSVFACFFLPSLALDPFQLSALAPSHLFHHLSLSRSPPSLPSHPLPAVPSGRSLPYLYQPFFSYFIRSLQFPLLSLSPRPHHTHHSVCPCGRERRREQPGLLQGWLKVPAAFSTSELLGTLLFSLVAFLPCTVLQVRLADLQPAGGERSSKNRWGIGEFFRVQRPGKEEN